MQTGGGALNQWTQELVKQLVSEILEKTKAWKTLFEYRFKVNLMNEDISSGVEMGLPKERYFIYIQQYTSG